MWVAESGRPGCRLTHARQAHGSAERGDRLGTWVRLPMNVRPYQGRTGHPGAVSSFGFAVALLPPQELSGDG
jgi:hypothetical protein